MGNRHRIFCAHNITIPGNGTLTCDKDNKSPEWELDVQQNLCMKRQGCSYNQIDALTNFMKNHPVEGSITCIYVYVIATLAFVPGIIVPVGAGLAYGSIYGLVEAVAIGASVIMIGVLQAGSITFLASRYFFRDFMSKKVEGFKVLKAVDKTLETQGFKIVLLFQLSPAIPFNIFNLLMGASAVKFWPFFGGMFFGMIPNMVAYVFIGAAAASAVKVSDDFTVCEKEGSGLVNTIMLVVGIVATLLATILISVYAKNELDKIVKHEEVKGRIEFSAHSPREHHTLFDVSRGGSREGEGGGEDQTACEVEHVPPVSP
jgi:uncharacterized membrane protein YdjX (TVP38/TMEM64 family)